MKLDMHLHSNYSTDGKAAPRQILKEARKLGLDGLCITDHNTLKGNAEVRKIAAEFGIIVLRGMEITSTDGHILAIGIGEEVPRDLSAEETLENIRAQGGMAVIPHPYRNWSGLGWECVRKIKPDAIEVLNSHSTKRENAMAGKLCWEMGLPMTAGSDSHELESIGRAYISIPDATDEDGVLKAIRSGEAKARGRSRNLIGTLKDRTLTVTQWMGRGFKKM
ncbi:MAG: CehA/McbA family metallohydrolase [Candidatus Thermoplasmatota archaeon]|nr:PHP domain-containing protein [Euryarchaeota archaeon]MBU4031235.1 CehA/McbA family metallohydrolase [Candidatus Thermoplasmatota archaeon]MBU4071963.1 CehA/McbA family metallohydrolase [Candidatus Thermoplasmatota archaeon]MBU4143621.1 CehA/McbA family metallohydrolase [Candidatus Thermoplasmatota archaeon]MBU4591281.1 CehA/McbA family metallohydrolase [Candidatus Thermoplasmatota archaeon]